MAISRLNEWFSGSNIPIAQWTKFIKRVSVHSVYDILFSYLNTRASLWKGASFVHFSLPDVRGFVCNTTVYTRFQLFLRFLVVMSVFALLESFWGWNMRNGIYIIRVRETGVKWDVWVKWAEVFYWTIVELNCFLICNNNAFAPRCPVPRIVE